MLAADFTLVLAALLLCLLHLGARVHTLVQGEAAATVIVAILKVQEAATAITP